MTSDTLSARRPTSRWPAALAAAAALVLLLLLLFGLNMRRGLNHDEHQFVGSAVLMVRDGLLPYAGFAYFHVPGQTLLNAALFALFDHLLLAARGAAVLWSWLALVLLLVQGLRFAPFVSVWARLGYALAGVVALMSAPLFVHTSGRAWNHDLPMVLALGGVICFLHALGADRRSAERSAPRRPWAWIVASGVLLGLAAATRLSYAFMAPPVVLAILLWGAATWGARMRLLGWLALGGVAGMTPVWWALAVAPEGFLFGNVVYNLQLNPAYYAGTGATDAMTTASKLRYLGELLVSRPANLVLPLLFVAGLLPALPHLRRPHALPLRLILLLLPFALLGAMSATPSQVQYYYMLYPFLLLGFFYSVALWTARQGIAAAVLVAGAVLSVASTAVSYAEGAEVLFRPDRWYPEKAHRRGQLIAELAGDGRVLTLAPVHAMEGRLATYPELVTGPLAWRVAHLVSPETRARVGLVAEPEMEALLAARPPRAVLTGFEEDDAELEQVLLAYASEHDFVPVSLPDEGVLWLSPQAAWADAIVLGAAPLPDAPVAPGDELALTLYLMKVAPIDRNLNVLVRVVNADGVEVARSEGWPYGSPTQAWQEGVTWPDGHTLAIDPNAAPGIYGVEVSFYDPETLAPFGDSVIAGYLVVANEAAPPSAAPLASFEHGLDLLAVDAGAQPWRAGPNTVTLTWQPSAPLNAPTTAFVHLLDAEGQLIAQRDQPPQQGFYPSDRWLPGESFQDRFVLDLPAGLPAGEYRLVIGWYDPASGQRLPRRGGDPAAGDAYTAATVQFAGSGE